MCQHPELAGSWQSWHTAWDIYTGFHSKTLGMLDVSSKCACPERNNWERAEALSSYAKSQSDARTVHAQTMTSAVWTQAG